MICELFFRWKSELAINHFNNEENQLMGVNPVVRIVTNVIKNDEVIFSITCCQQVTLFKLVNESEAR